MTEAMIEEKDKKETTPRLLKPGWLKAQFEEVKKDIAAWPKWMKQAAGLEPYD